MLIIKCLDEYCINDYNKCGLLNINKLSQKALIIKCLDEYRESANKKIIPCRIIVYQGCWKTFFSGIRNKIIVFLGGRILLNNDKINVE